MHRSDPPIFGFPSLGLGDEIYIWNEGNSDWPPGTYTIRRNQNGRLFFDESIDSADWDSANQPGLRFRADVPPQFAANIGSRPQRRRDGAKDVDDHRPSIRCFSLKGFEGRDFSSKRGREGRSRSVEDPRGDECPEAMSSPRR